MWSRGLHLSAFASLPVILLTLPSLVLLYGVGTASALALPKPAAATDTVQTACLEILDAAVVRGSGDSGIPPGAEAVYEQCLKRGGLQLHAAPTGGAEEECRDLVQLHTLARHYGAPALGRDSSAQDSSVKGTFSPSAFCAAAEDSLFSSSGASSRVNAAQDACTAGLTAALANPAVEEAAVTACVAAAKGSTTPSESECRRYVAALSDAAASPGHGQSEPDRGLDVSALCAGLLAGGRSFPEAFPATTNDGQVVPAVESDSDGERGVLPKTRGSKEEQQLVFVEDCSRYANNAIQRLGGPNAVASSTNGTGAGAAGESDIVADVESGCEAQLGAGLGRDFCRGYAGLVQNRASEEEIAAYCSDQFRTMRETDVGAAPDGVAAVSASVPDAAADATADESSTAAKGLIATASTRGVADAKSGTSVACEEYLSGVRRLDLPQEEAKRVVAMDCPGHFGLDVDACTGLARLFVAGDALGACRMANVVAEQSAPVRHPGPDLGAVCKRTVDKVEAAGLTGAALERAAADVCGKELLPNSQNSSAAPRLRVRLGCRYLARRLVAESGSGGHDIAGFAATFCSNLTGHPLAKSSMQVVQRSPLEHAAPPETPAPKVVAKSTEVADNHSDFLSNFLDHYDTQVPLLSKEQKQRMQETRRKADQLFGASPQAKATVPGHTPPLATLAVLAPGAARPDKETVASTLGSGKPRRRLRASFVDETRDTATEAIDSQASTSEDTAAASGIEDNADIDELVASFAAEQSS